MNTQKFIIKFFPEIMIKGASRKRQMIGQLYNNIYRLSKNISEETSLKKFLDKIEIECQKKVVTETRLMLLQTPGVELVLEALQFDDMSNLDLITEKVNEQTAHEIQGKTFVIRSKRVGKHDFKSPKLEQAIGGFMLSQNPNSKGVDLHKPEVTIRIELLNDQLNIITSKHKGLGGFPLGTQGSILSLMSGGFDSTVASYLTMKRGLKTHYIFFNLGGLAHEIGVKQVAYFLWSKFGSSHRVSFISVPFDSVLTEIFRSTRESYMGVTLKRLMLKASEKIANRMEIDALLTGESVAQVSSQTLRNLAIIDKATDMLVIRPLATMNKPEIIDIATQIGTKHFAADMPEYCGVISKNPIIKGSFKRIEEEDYKFNYSVLDKAIENAVTINVDEIINDIQEISQTEIVSDISSGEFVIIDIRGFKETIQTVCETINIPYHKLKNEFKKLPQDKEYLLFCDKGVMSQLHAQYLHDEEKYTNIRVYRP